MDEDLGQVLAAVGPRLRELVLGPGEAAEFGTEVPHWFGNADDQPAELLVIFGRQGERAHLRARPARPGQADDRPR